MESKKVEQTQASAQAKPSRKGTLTKTTRLYNMETIAKAMEPRPSTHVQELQSDAKIAKQDTGVSR